MKKQNRKNIIISVLIGIIVILLVIISVLFYKNIYSNEVNNDMKQEQNNNISNDDYNDDNNISNDDYNDDNNTKYDESSFIRQRQIILVEEPNCTGNSSSLIATIYKNGNIFISQNGGASIVTPGNAKYLFRVGKLACDVVSLYYITDDNELYVLDNPKSDVDQTATKVIDAEVIEFLGTEIKEVEDGYNNYLKVLLKDNTVKYINYMTTVK